MLRFALVITACCTVAAQGCTSPARQLTPEQRSAIETRPIDGSRDDVLRAAAAAMLDEGFIFTMSDHAAGLIAGERVTDPMYAQSYARGRASRGSSYLYVSRTVVWVRSKTSRSSDLRVQLLVGNRQVASEQHTKVMWARVQQRMLSYLPAPKGALP